MLELRGCMAIALLLFSNNLGAEELYKLLGFDPTAPEFDRAVYDLVETPENIVASVGLASLMLMGEIDDELSFGDSGEWSVPIGEPHLRLRLWWWLFSYSHPNGIPQSDFKRE